MADQYAVFGNPIEHSLSPDIHAAFARQTGEPVDYQRQLVPVGEFAESVKRFFDAGGRGLNVTLPFKLEAYRMAERLTPRAERAGAVNTLYCEDGVLVGDNTDGVGLVNDIKANLGWEIARSTVLVLGAGGAVRGVMLPLLQEKPAQVIIANRTLAKAEQLVEQFAREAVKQKVELHALGFDKLHHPFDIVINGTSASISKELPPLQARVVEGASCYDMMYSARPTTFLAWAADHGASATADGLGMLVEQAAEAFFAWRAVRPQTQPVIADLRDRLSKR